jgi:hypothetical protein
MSRLFAFILGSLGLLCSSSPALALPAVQIGLSISLDANLSSNFPDLTGTAQFYTYSPAEAFTPLLPGIDIGQLEPGGTFATSFQGGSRCLADGSCALAFSFTGLSGNFPAFAFSEGISPPTPPAGPVPIPYPNIGVIVAYDAPETIGSWQVTSNAIPEPPAVALFGAGLLLLLGLGIRHRSIKIAASPRA